MQGLGRIEMGETGMEGRTVWHCDILGWMNEREGRGWMGRLGGGDSWL